MHLNGKMCLCLKIPTFCISVVIFMHVLPEPPEIPNNETIGGVLSVAGTEGQLLTVTCVCRGGFPAPTLAWYRNTVTSEFVKNTSTPTDSSATSVTVTYTFTPGRNEDKINYICQSSFQDLRPEVINQTAVQLFLKLKPSTPAVQQVGDATAGSTATLQCHTSGFRPKATIAISWKYKDTVPSGSLQSQPDNDKYRATSTLQLPVQRGDNGGSVQCIVAHSTLLYQLSGSTTMNVHFATVSAAVTGNIKIVADGTTPLSLTCTVGDANPPVSGFSWNGPSGVGAMTSQTVTLTPTRDDDRAAVTCTATNTVGSTISQPVILDLHYSPIATIPGGNKTVIEGTPDVDITCTASSNPAATFTWYKGSAWLVTGTQTHNSWSYRIDKIHRNHSGLYRCEADNGIMPVDEASMTLNVQYPPNVTATGHDGTVTDQSVIITCSPTGVPDTYTYYSWVHSWSDGHVISQPELPATQTLTLTGLTYQHSGVYTCRVSNGVAPYGTSDITTGSTSFITIKSDPVIIDPNTTDSKVHKVFAQLHHPTNINITYYSNVDGSIVSCHRVINNVGISASVGVVTTDTAVIQLTVFDSTVPASGTRATVKLTIDNESELGLYHVKVRNSIWTTTIDLHIISEGPPEPPEYPAVLGVSTTSVNVSWNLGFHGGLYQTFVVQYSTDGVTWTDGATLDTGLSESRDRQYVSVDSLIHGQLYHLRIYAYNEKGQSAYTHITTVTTDTSVSDTERAAYTDIGPIVGWLVAALVVIAVFVGVVVLYKKGYRINKNQSCNKSDKYRARVYENKFGTDKRKSANDSETSATQDNGSPSATASAGTGPGSVYEEVDEDPQAGADSRDESITATYEMLEIRKSVNRSYDELRLPAPSPSENSRIP